jgi:shikimate dehydrogenase
MKYLGLIGYPLGHSFSKSYFNTKFAQLGIEKEWYYETFSIENIEKLTDILRGYPNLVGLNVTIPYKQAVLPFLDKLDETAAEIGAVNCIRFEKGKLIGYNTDVYGFEKSLLGLLNTPDLETLLNLNLKALILGTGGASKAVLYVLKKWHIPVHYVSRTRSDTSLSYEDIDAEMMHSHHLIVNTTPLGMSPNTEGCPPLPYEHIGNQHFLYDLVYNPETTEFMKRGIAQGAKVKNGLDMLIFQAEKGWKIWNQK